MSENEANGKGPRELHLKYRPKRLEDLVGQEDVVRVLSRFFADGNLPHAIGLYGSSGTGKTTTARIIKRLLKCQKLNFRYVNAASDRGIETARTIQQETTKAPWGGEKAVKIWLMDECHRLTPDAQASLLVTLEDMPPYAYYLLATTDPQKLSAPIRGRLTPIHFKPVSPEHLRRLVVKVAGEEKIPLKSKDVLDAITEGAGGSAREALVLLGKIAGLESDEERLSALQGENVKHKSGELFKVLLNPRVKWPEVAAILKDLDDDPEQMRRGIRNYAAAVLMNGKDSSRAGFILTAFDTIFYDKAGLVAACHEIFGKGG